MSLCVKSTGLNPALFDFGDHEHRSHFEGIAALAARPAVAAFLGNINEAGLEAATDAAMANATEIAIVYAMIGVVRARMAERVPMALFTEQWTVDRFAAALDAVSAWHADLKTDHPSATCVGFELQFLHENLVGVFENGAPVCSEVHRIVTLIEQQDPVFGQQIHAFRGIYRLARRLGDADLAVALPASCHAWIARKRGLPAVYDLLLSEYEHLLAVAPVMITGHLEGAAVMMSSDLMGSLRLCRIDMKQGFTSRVNDTELRFDNLLHPDFWMSVPLPELLQRVPDELLRNEMARRKRLRR
jgi:hypothetical protein